MTRFSFHKIALSNFSSVVKFDLGKFNRRIKFNLLVNTIKVCVDITRITDAERKYFQHRQRKVGELDIRTAITKILSFEEVCQNKYV